MFPPFFKLMDDGIWFMLPAELWPIVGDFLFMSISREETSNSLVLRLKPSMAYAILYPGDEDGEGFVQPCQIS